MLKVNNNYCIEFSIDPIIPRENKIMKRINARTDNIIFTIPSHLPIFASILPASGDCPLSIAFSSLFPIIHAAIARITGHIIYESIPRTSAIIALELALPPDIPGGGGGGGELNPEEGG